MKSKVIVMSKKKYIKIISFALIFISLLIGKLSIGTEKFDNNFEAYSNYKTSIASVAQEDETINIIENKLEIQEIDGVKVVGRLEIPKIELVTYILEDTSKETLNKSVTKLCGPNVNGVGNLCITGHNYHNDKMFGDLKKIEVNDKIYITGTNGMKIEYVVYDTYTVYPKEVECLSQETFYEREITLITCTTGAIKRLIVKATEVYD